MILLKLLIRLLCWPYFLVTAIGGFTVKTFKWAWGSEWTNKEKELMHWVTNSLKLKGKQ